MSRIILDLETFSLDDAANFIEEPSAPSNWKDEAKIAQYIQDATAKAISRCALDPDLCRIVCLGWQYDGGAEVLMVAKTEADEKEALDTFWDRLRSTDIIIGFNVLGFDLPVLIRRSQYLGIDTPAVNVDRYRTPHIDLMERLSFNGKLKYRGLDFYCRRFGIHVDDPSTGKDIDAMVKAGDWSGVAQHCHADITKTRLLAERLGVIEPWSQQPELEVVL